MSPTPKNIAWITPELIAETIRVWQPHYAEEITPEVAITMVQNVGRLFTVLGSNHETICSTRAG